jgi:hypothetical protein
MVIFSAQLFDLYQKKVVGGDSVVWRSHDGTNQL